MTEPEPETPPMPSTDDRLRAAIVTHVELQRLQAMQQQIRDEIYKVQQQDDEARFWAAQALIGGGPAPTRMQWVLTVDLVGGERRSWLVVLDKGDTKIGIQRIDGARLVKLDPSHP